MPQPPVGDAVTTVIIRLFLHTLVNPLQIVSRGLLVLVLEVDQPVDQLLLLGLKRDHDLLSLLRPPRDVGNAITGRGLGRLLLLPLLSALGLWHHTLRPHADLVALFKTALLALAPHVHVDLTVVPVLAGVVGTFGDGSSEEALASLAGEGVVVIARGPVPAHQTQLLTGPGGGALLVLPVVLAPGPAPRVMAVLVARRLEGGSVRGHCTGVERSVLLGELMTRPGLTEVIKGVL